MSNGDYSYQLISLWSHLAAAVDSCFLILVGLQYDIIFGALKTSTIEYLQIWPIQGSTILKSMPRAFHRCITYGGGIWFNSELWAPEVNSNFNLFLKQRWAVQKTVTTTICKIEPPFQISVDSLPPKKPFLRLFLFVGENGLYWLNCPILTPQCYILLESCASDLSENLVESQILSFYKLPEFPWPFENDLKPLADSLSYPHINNRQKL